jgi:single-strand DNA-binding protein
MRGYQQAVLLGTLRSEPEALTSKGGKAYIKFELEVLTFRRKDGIDEEVREVVPIIAFGKLGEIVANYVKRGDPIHLVAHISSTEFKTESGGTRRSISVIADSVQLLPNGRKPDVGDQSRAGEPPEQPLPKLKKVPLDENGDPVTLPF